MSGSRETIGKKKRIVVKIGSSSLTHRETGDMDYIRMEKLVRELSDIRNQGKEVILVTSGAIAAGKKALNCGDLCPDSGAEAMAVKQACSAVGQARLMMTYQRLFAEYNQVAAQILMTRNTIVDNLSAIVAALVGADLLILLSDIDGLYTDDPRRNPEARFISRVDELTDELMDMGKASTGSNVGTGGMNTKLTAAKIATKSGVDMVIANSRDIGVLHRLLAGEEEGTLFVAGKDENFDLPDFVEQIHKT